jgi:hypothetical protein
VYETTFYHHLLHFTFHGWASQTGDNIKSIYMWPRSMHVVASVYHSIKLTSLDNNVSCELATSVAVFRSNVLFCSLDTRTPRRWIYLPDLPPQQRRRLSSPSIEDRAVRLELEPVVSDSTQPRWFGCICCQKDPTQHFPRAVLAGPQWSSALAT